MWFVDIEEHHFWHSAFYFINCSSVECFYPVILCICSFIIVHNDYIDHEIVVDLMFVYLFKNRKIQSNVLMSDA